MRQRSSLSTKVRLLVLLPLTIQLGFLIVLASLQTSAEAQLKESIKAQTISDLVNKLLSDTYETARYCANPDAISESPEALEEYNALYTRTKEDTKNLREFMQKEDPEKFKKLEPSAQAASDLFEMVEKLRAIKDTDSPEAHKQKKILWKTLRKLSKEAILGGLVHLAKEQKKEAQVRIEKRAALREQSQQISLVMGVANLVFSLFVAIYLTRQICRRIDVLNDNSYRLASNLPLNRRIGSGDELGRLDDAFHNMAREVREAARKEKAILENARDLICTIDRSCKMTAINPACTAMLGYQPEDLFGTHFGDLLEDGREAAVSFMNQLKQSSDLPPVEMNLKRKDGTPVYAVVTAHWSEEEGAAFCVIHDISDKRRAEQLRKEVVAMITHDLRTPMMTVRNILQFLDSDKHGKLDDKGHNYCQMGTFNVDRMNTLVNDMLDIEKIESGEMEITRSKVLLDECFDACQASLSAFAEARGINLEFGPARIVFDGDEEKIDRVLVNLIGNAIKFSPDGGQVAVFAKEEDGFVCVCVEDHGKGIPLEQIDDVFKRFHQVDAESDSKGGSGLGLTICKAFVELHGGRIWVESQVGEGTKFMFTLPLPQRSDTVSNDSTPAT